MKILTSRIQKEELIDFEEVTFFDDMIKGVVDVKDEKVALNAELHSDLEELLLANGAAQDGLYGINIIFDDYEIEFDSIINIARNKQNGYRTVGRYVEPESMRNEIVRVVKKWIEL
jgi:hypothetical protein